MVAVVAISSVIRCGDCGLKTKRVHATRKVRVADLPVSGRPVNLVWHRRRFRCGNCGTTTTEGHRFIAERMTQRLARAVERDVKEHDRAGRGPPLRAELAPGHGPRAVRGPRMAYGFRSRANYVARVLLVCSGLPPELSPT